MADRADSVELALEELEREPLPTSTRDRAASPPEDDIEIAHAEDEGGTPEAPAAPAPEQSREIPAEEGIEALRARLQASDSARLQAEARAHQAEQARVQATGAKQDSDVQFLTTALEGTRQTISVLEANQAEAYAVQDFNQAAKINTEIAKAAWREQQIELGLEQMKTAPREQPRPAPPPQEDPVEAVASRLTPNAAAWVRAHREFVLDPAKNERLVAAHNVAIAHGLVADSDDYVRYVEELVMSPPGWRGNPEPQQERRDSVAETRRTAPPAAPPSRGNGAGANPTRVTLTHEQRETAHENFPDEMLADPTGRKAEQAYARNMLILRREKRMN